MLFTRPIWILSAVASYAAAAPLEPRAENCVEGVMIIAARGTDSTSTNPDVTDPKFADIGGLQNIATQVIDAAGKGSYLQALPYPASPGAGYFISIGHGIDAAQTMIKNYVDQCNATVTPRIVLLGYSQGAQVMTSALIGGQGRPNLQAYEQYITAGALFASPSFTVGFEPLDAGNSTTSGLFARDAADAKYFNTHYGDRVRDYCEAGDEFCATGLGPDAHTIHTDEVQTYSAASIKFLLPLVS